MVLAQITWFNLTGRQPVIARGRWLANLKDGG
jgi:hypothetical protein